MEVTTVLQISECVQRFLIGCTWCQLRVYTCIRIACTNCKHIGSTTQDLRTSNFYYSLLVQPGNLLAHLLIAPTLCLQIEFRRVHTRFETEHVNTLAVGSISTQVGRTTVNFSMYVNEYLSVRQFFSLCTVGCKCLYVGV